MTIHFTSAIAPPNFSVPVFLFEDRNHNIYLIKYVLSDQVKESMLHCEKKPFLRKSFL